MAKIVIIKKNEEFQRLFEKGHSIYGRYLVVYFLHNTVSIEPIRYGFCVGKKIGNAVKRNRIKRLFREAVRAVSFSSSQSWDILLVARGPVQTASLADIIKEIKHIFDKADSIHASSPGGRSPVREGSQ